MLGIRVLQQIQLGEERWPDRENGKTSTPPKGGCSEVERHMKRSFIQQALDTCRQELCWGTLAHAGQRKLQVPVTPSVGEDLEQL